MKIGDQHQVPCVKVSGVEWASTEQWIPVIVPIHNDAEFLDFPTEHLHIDFRYLDSDTYERICSRHARDFDPARLLGVVLGEHQLIEGPASQMLTFLRPMPVYPSRQRSGEQLSHFCALEDAYADWVIDPAVPICPHRGLPLTGLVDSAGIAVCSGHGLAWDMTTGRCIRRFRDPQPSNA